MFTLTVTQQALQLIVLAFSGLQILDLAQPRIAEPVNLGFEADLVLLYSFID